MATARGVAALLVNDDPLTSTTRLAELESRGYAATLTGSEAALALIEESHPALVFIGTVSDLGKSSADFLQSLRTSKLSQHTPVVILSNQPSGGARRGKLQSVRRERW
jgi:DNA-binding response OmpR family regulator